MIPKIKVKKERFIHTNMYTSEPLFAAFFPTHHFPRWGGRRKIKTQISVLPGATTITVELSSFLLKLSVVVMFIFMFTPEYNWILEHSHVVTEVVFGDV